jgi:hypothetical protein
MPFDSAPARLSPEALMSDPTHMIAWLRDNFEPTDVICDNVNDCDSCLGAEFLRAMGFEHVMWYCHTGKVDGKYVAIDPLDPVARAIASLWTINKYSPVTAARALKALDA